jgi:hypothetical protein
LDEGRNRTAEPHMPGHTIDEFLVNKYKFFLVDFLSSVAIILLLYVQVLILSYILHVRPAFNLKYHEIFFNIFFFL